MRAVGRMREKVQIMKPGRVSDGALGFNRQDITVVELWARIQPVTSREIYRYQHLEQEITHKVTTRYHADVRQGQWVQWGAIQLYIEAVTPLGERKEFMELITRQGGNL
jgi:SPP1 family predicted phage head-tail adaptor